MTSFTSRQLATIYEILVARTEFLVALATRKAQLQTLLLHTVEAYENEKIQSSYVSWVKRGLSRSPQVELSAYETVRWESFHNMK